MTQKCIGQEIKYVVLYTWVDVELVKQEFIFHIRRLRGVQLIWEMWEILCQELVLENS